MGTLGNTRIEGLFLFLCMHTESHFQPINFPQSSEMFRQSHSMWVRLGAENHGKYSFHSTYG